MAEKLPEKLNLEIVTPSRQIFHGEVDEVSIPGLNGYLGILPGHAALLTELKIGVITCRKGAERERFYCGWGFAEVLAGQVSILAEVAERPDEIDVNQAQEQKVKAEALLRAKGEEDHYRRALEMWESAVARLQVVDMPIR
jgi:F-type H+-transporting ATPase subunit epsilon